MRKLLGGGIAAGLAAVGTLAFALPSSAQEEPPKTVSVLTPEVQQSQPVQLQNGEGSECLDGEAGGKVLLSAETTDFAIDVGAPVDTDPATGAWQIDFSVIDQNNTPVPFKPGAYTGHATCVAADGTTPVFTYEDFSFNVVPDPGAPPEEPAPPAAPPAPETPQGDRDPTG